MTNNYKFIGGIVCGVRQRIHEDHGGGCVLSGHREAVAAGRVRIRLDPLGVVIVDDLIHGNQWRKYMLVSDLLIESYLFYLRPRQH